MSCSCDVLALLETNKSGPQASGYVLHHPPPSTGTNSQGTRLRYEYLRRFGHSKQQRLYTLLLAVRTYSYYRNTSCNQQQNLPSQKPNEHCLADFSTDLQDLTYYLHIGARASGSGLYRQTPPTSCDFSKIVTRSPSSRRIRPAAKPAAPAPITATDAPDPCSTARPLASASTAAKDFIRASHVVKHLVFLIRPKRAVSPLSPVACGCCVRGRSRK